MRHMIQTIKLVTQEDYDLEARLRAEGNPHADHVLANARTVAFVKAWHGNKPLVGTIVTSGVSYHHDFSLLATLPDDTLVRVLMYQVPTA